MSKKILVTGAQGFIGSVLINKLLSKGYSVVATDIGYFKNCKLIPYKDPVKIIKTDINSFPRKFLKNVYAVIHLAALSNDPLGNFNKKLTYKTNVLGTKSLAQKSKDMGVKKFLFSSSCIMYGANLKSKASENSKLKPLTEYAKSKVLAEKILKKMANKNFSPIFLRNGTIYGFSPRIRLDTVLNNFIAQAYSNNEINIYGDGKPYRPVIHVDDVCNIILKFLEIDRKKIHNQAYNIGAANLNFNILQLAKVVQKIFKNCKLNVLKQSDVDYRTYEASFAKLKKLLKGYKFKNTPEYAVKEINKYFNKLKISKNIYKSNKYIRLKYLKLKYKKLFNG